MQKKFITDRLLLDELTIHDSSFIFDLVNSAEWIQFIGDRNVKNTEDAENYIRKILSSPNIEYRVVRLKTSSTPIGIITFIKRDYLMQHDIGFAFLKEYSGKGFAIEAAQEVLKDVMQSSEHSTVLATTLPDNISSIKLLERLGFVFEKELMRDDENLLVYTISENRKPK